MCSICCVMSHENNECPHAAQIDAIRRMADLAGYYIELVMYVDFRKEIRVTWRHNSHNPKNFCGGDYFLQMCQETIEFRDRKK